MRTLQPAFAIAAARSLGALLWRPAPAPRYDLSDPKAAEEAIVRDALCGAVQYRRWTAPTGMLLMRHGVAKEAGVVVRLGHGGSVGTCTFVRVNGVDMSYELCRNFDARRVAEAVLDGHDPRSKQAAPAAAPGARSAR